MIKSIIREQLNTVILVWAKERGIETLPQYTLEEPPKNIPADLATNIAMVLAKQMKTNPRAIATELAKLLIEAPGSSIAGTEIAGAGFLNLKLSETFLQNGLSAILEDRKPQPVPTEYTGKKIMIEFVSANPTGPLHIGHGRGAAIGDSLARIFSYLNYAVIREYYLNDVGNQMEMLGRSVEARYKELKGEKVTFPEDGYKGDYIKDIARKVVDSGDDPSKVNFREVALKEMMSTIDKDLLDFDVRFNSWFSESVIAAQRDPAQGNTTAVDRACAMLKETGMAFDQDGALWFASTKYGDDKDRVLRRSDGRYTYLASDIAYHQNKMQRGFNRLINLWGADHHGYVPRMKAAIQALGAPVETLDVILYQLVSLVRNGVPVAMSTRAGEFVTLEEVLREVGKDACRFFFLLRAPDSHLEFDLELAKKQSSENPVFYVQYVNARCSSIFRESKNQNYDLSDLKADIRLLTAPEERALIKKLISLGDTLELCVRTQSPHHLTGYLMETADYYHRFYEKCRVLGDDRALSSARLALAMAVAKTIKRGLNLLGVSAPEKM